MNNKSNYERFKSCTCYQCVKMCYSCPCKGTPLEIKRIIEAGYGHKLMLNYYEGEDKEGNYIYVEYLMPAKVGKEGRLADFVYWGRCTLLENDRCMLHEQGLKPIEGVMADCEKESIDAPTINLKFALMWARPYAQNIVKQWTNRKDQS